MGSEKGKPISMRFDPAASSAGIVATVVSMSGYPAAMNGIIAICFLARNPSKVCASVSRIRAAMIRGEGGFAICRLRSEISNFRSGISNSDLLSLSGFDRFPNRLQHLHVLQPFFPRRVRFLVLHNPLREMIH